MPFLSIEHRGHRYTTALDASMPIGRSVSRRKGLRVTDSGVSRRHATIELRGRGCVVVDHDSRNGTYVNGKRIEQERALNNGDRIRVGRTRFFFHQESETKPVLCCAICQTNIEDSESTTACPECDLIFHADCWTENYGCSAYGCTQVNALAPASAPAQLAPTDADDDSGSVQTEYLLLAASALSAVLGALLYGGLSAIMLIVLSLMRKNRVIWLAMIVAVFGAAGGFAASHYWWKN